MPVVALAVDRTLRHMEEVARFGVDDLMALHSRLHPKRAVSDVDRRLVLTVVMPARAHAGLGADEARPETFDLDRSLTGHPRRRISFDASFGGDQPNGFRLAHVAESSARLRRCRLSTALTSRSSPRPSSSTCIGSGATSPVEATQAVLARIDALNPTLNAFCLVDADAALGVGARERGALAAAARRCGAARRRAGVDQGPDPHARAGRRCAARAPSTPTQPWDVDAPATARLREAGAVLRRQDHDARVRLQGRDQLAAHRHHAQPVGSGEDAGRVLGRHSGRGRRRAWARCRVGTDGAGSVRIPAAFCGNFGLKPSFGRVPAYPLSPFGTRRAPRPAHDERAPTRR